VTQITLHDAATADALKSQGQESVARNAENFVAIMRTAARQISEESGFVTVENLRHLADSLGLQPHHCNAYGAIFMGKHWRIIGRKKSAVPSSHSREIKIWEWVA